jgi:HK97 gp10 family phage protein
MAVQVGIPAAELKAALGKLRALGTVVTKKERKQVLRKGATILRNTARENVPIAAEPYKDSKGNTIQPGLVRDAVQIRNFAKSFDLFVGIAKVSGILAYWAKWLEFGSSAYKSKPDGYGFMRRALASSKDQVIAQIVSDAKKLFDRKIKELQSR